jgi:hypothetical protein
MAQTPPAKPKAKAKANGRAPSDPGGGGRTTTIVVVGVIVVVAIAAIVAIASTRKDNKTAAPVPTGKSAAAIVEQVTSIPTSVFDAVGAGTTSLPLQHGTVSLAKVDGKPQVFYVGAEFCPYCATQRWAVVAALGRFGTFSKLGLSHSSADDVFANTPTFTFHGSRYTSKYVAFTGVETRTNELEASGQYGALDPLTEAQGKVYAAENPGGGIPFLDIDGQFVANGVGYKAEVLQGHSAKEIAAALRDPSSDIAKGALGTANVITAAICVSTDEKPADVCSSKAVQTIEKGFRNAS